jgi:adenylate cyclase
MKPESKLFSFARVLPSLTGALATFMVVAFVLIDPHGLATIGRERAFDLIYLARPRASIAAPVVVIDIDRSSLARLGGWPLPRARLADIVEALFKAGASAVAFDIFLAGPDRHSPRAIALELSTLPGGETVKSLAEQLPDTDVALAQALSRAPSVLGALAAPGGPAPAFDSIQGVAALDARHSTEVAGFSGPYAPLGDAALEVGVISLPGEEDGIVRRAPLLFRSGETVAPSLALATVRLAVSAAVLEIEGHGDILRFGSHATPLDAGGAMRIHWSGLPHWQERTFSAFDLLDGSAPKSRLAGAVALIGSSAPEAGALRPTPVGALTPSVQIQAEAVEQLLQGVAPKTPSNFIALDIAATLVLGTLGVVLVLTNAPASGALALVGLVLAWIAAVAATFIFTDILIDPTAPVAAVLLAGNAAAGVAFAQTRRIKALISQRFEQYLAPDVVRAILAAPDRLKREGEMREVTALFTDIENFTRMTEAIEPKALIALLDRYFDGVCAIITEHGGMIDSFVGDAVHAFFNMPLDLAEHADRALACAKAIIAFADEFKRTPAALAAGFGRTRIGVETGPAIVGDVGGTRRLNYTAHGAVANAAARLEAANKQFGTAICVGPGAAAAARHTALLAVGRLQLRGFGAEIDIFTPTEAPLKPPTP